MRHILDWAAYIVCVVTVVAALFVSGSAAAQVTCITTGTTTTCFGPRTTTTCITTGNITQCW